MSEPTAPVVERIVAAIAGRLATITAANGYPITVSEVVRPRRTCRSRTTTDGDPPGGVVDPASAPFVMQAVCACAGVAGSDVLRNARDSHSRGCCVSTWARSQYFSPGPERLRPARAPQLARRRDTS